MILVFYQYYISNNISINILNIKEKQRKLAQNPQKLKKTPPNKPTKKPKHPQKPKQNQRKQNIQYEKQKKTTHLTQCYCIRCTGSRLNQGRRDGKHIGINDCSSGNDLLRNRELLPTK